MVHLVSSFLFTTKFEQCGFIQILLKTPKVLYFLMNCHPIRDVYLTKAEGETML